MRPILLSVLASLLLAPAISAQEHEHPATPAAADSAETGMQHEGMDMSAGPLGIGMHREGSGTSWQPDASPVYALHSMAGPWELMLHGNVFAQYIDEGSERGDSQLGLVNWFHGMASRSVGSGRLGFRAMLSAEEITVGKCGYPDLLATGEFCEGEPLHDRQHPHDLFMELAAQYQRPLGSNLAFELYGGPVGEPALGPVAFPHRVSAMPGPLAPIGHHWQDATHISFGVATAGIYGRRWKLEGSLFNGREPDENRYDFDLGPLDSYSGRVSIVPDDRWALQASLGRLTEAEAPREVGESRADVTRVTASATYHQPLAPSGIWANTLAWGQNRAHGLITDAFLVETNLNLNERNIFFGRGELVRKSGEDLVIEEVAPALAHDLFRVGKLSLGYVRQFGQRGAVLPGIGAQVSVNFFPSDLEPVYGSRMPGGLAVFASIRPRPMRMAMPAVPVGAAGGMHGMQMQPAPRDQHAEHGQPQLDVREDSAGAPGHEGHTPAESSGGEIAGDVGHARADGMMESESTRLLGEIHMRMMADPVIRRRVATDSVLEGLMQRIPQVMMGDTTGAHPGHGMESSMQEMDGATGGAESEAMEFITLLLSDPQVEARVHADPRLHQLWSDPQVQSCLATMRRMRDLGQELPAACPAAPVESNHPSH
jgi:hypothetical protein